MKKAHPHRKLINGIAVALFTVAAVLFFVLLLLRVDVVRAQYDELQFRLYEFELRVAAIPQKWLFCLVMMMLFFIRAYVPLFPISALCLITGMVFEMPVSFLINLAGITVLLLLRYYDGYRHGIGNVKKIMQKYNGVWELAERYGKSNPLLLFGLRLVPFMPLNTISRFYGSVRFSFWEYMLLSLGGFAPRLISYTIIGRNVYDPFSSKFIVPIIILLLISGISLLLLNGVLSLRQARVARISGSDEPKEARDEAPPRSEIKPRKSKRTIPRRSAKKEGRTNSKNIL